MHWILLTGGEAARASGKIVHRASLQQCSSQQLGERIHQSMQNLYSYPDGLEPPSPHLQTWVLGFQVHDPSIIEKKVLPEMKNRMERLGIPWKYDAFNEDGPEGSKTYNVLSREKCQAWLHSVADHLMDSKVEAEIALYEFTDRPEGFIKPEISQDQEPWKCATASMFREKTRFEAPADPKQISTDLPTVNPTVAVKPADRLGAADNGAGPSRPSKPATEKEDPKIALETARALRIAGIRASLEYNGYPPDVIEDLIKNKLSLYRQTSGNSFGFYLKLTNELSAKQYADIDRNPYPGGKITEKSARKCHKSEGCTLPFGHDGMCRLNTTLRPNDCLELIIQRATAKIRTALIYAGYPIEVVNTMMENDFRNWVNPNSKYRKYRWSLKLFNGERVYSLPEILKFPYPGGEVAVNPICLTVGCRKKFGHNGACGGPNSVRNKIKRGAGTEPVASPVKKKSRAICSLPLPSQPSRTILSSSSDDDEDLDEEEEDSEDYAGSLGFSDSTEGDSLDSDQEEGIKNGRIIRSNSRAAKVSPAGASRPVGRGDAVVDNGGAGPSRPSNPVNRIEGADNALETGKQLKIAGIRASLQYNGYPPDVIEDLIKNKLSLYRQTGVNTFMFVLKLPNGSSAQSYTTIDANPYPGGQITEKSARKCFRSENCTKPFGHDGMCRLKTTLDTNDHLNSLMEHATAGVRTALIYAGYPIDVVDTMMENGDFRIWVLPDSKSNKYRWSVKLFNKKNVYSLLEILKYPYPGGKIAVNPICHTVGCGKKLGHNGPCHGPNSLNRRAKRKAAPVARSSPAKRQPRAISPLANQPSRTILSSSSDDEQEKEESDKEEEQEERREEESPIYLLTTEDEEDSDFQGEDEYSSLYD